MIHVHIGVVLITPLRFPGRVFDRKLVKRLSDAAISERYGADPDRMKDLMSFGTQTRDDGGELKCSPHCSDVLFRLEVFETDIDVDLRIESIYWQDRRMRPYVLMYGDYAIVDGTHWMTV